jgi:AmmeMemoRadiSam system protein A
MYAVKITDGSAAGKAVIREFPKTGCLCTLRTCGKKRLKNHRGLEMQKLTPEFQQTLLEIARNAIVRGLEKKRFADPPVRTLPTALMEKRATFVTLKTGGRLRGCIGMLEACRPLAEDVAAKAFAAAFEDPRFPPLTKGELEELELHISVLSPPEEMNFSSEADLLQQIRPGLDGLILQEGFRRGTFLPSVWEELPEKDLFWRHLKSKAGLPAGYWSDTLRVFRYTADCFPS